ncbi:hypothetical protein Q3G72_031090 [Acer saccharum]|nr:hypothetical protein Q3G72_031090 [Acer saccharum]
MHIYGWPINAKVAEYEWNSRRSSPANRSTKDDNTKERVGREPPQSFYRERQSYAEAVKTDIHVHSGNAKVQDIDCLSMAWTQSIAEDDWLYRSAVGDLRIFSSVESVNRKLESRGFAFSSTYLGGKGIVWTFESTCERDGFIRNSFFWKDSFVLMSSWKDSIQGRFMLKWIDEYGVLLNCWCYAFFKQLGDQISETMWVDESTVQRRRLDKGRIMVLVPFDKKVSCCINVSQRKIANTVRLVEAPATVDMSWISQMLGLNPSTNLKSSSGMVDAELVLDNDGKDGNFGSDSLVERKVGILKARDNDRLRKFGKLQGTAETAERSAFIFSQRSSKSSSYEIGGTRVALDKGKRLWIRKIKPKYQWFPSYKGNLVIEKVRKVNNRSKSEDDSSSESYETDSQSHPNLLKGECSKSFPDGLGYPILDGPEINGLVRSSDPIKNWVEAGLQREGSLENLEDNMEECNVSSPNTSGNNGKGSNFQKGALEQGIDLCVDLRNQSDGYISGEGPRGDVPNDLAKVVPASSRNIRGRGIVSSIKVHPMKIRWALNSVE